MMTEKENEPAEEKPMTEQAEEASDDSAPRGKQADAVEESGNGKAGSESESGPEEKLAELNDRYLRLYSEFDNYKRRTAKERLELFKTAGEEVIVALLPILDDFDRALAAAESSTSGKEVKEGIALIRNKLMATLAQKGLEPMESMGKTFDTDNHEAITRIPAPKKKLKGKVVDVIEKGFFLNGKVIRHAKVVVGS